MDKELVEAYLLWTWKEYSKYLQEQRDRIDSPRFRIFGTGHRGQAIPSFEGMMHWIENIKE